MKAKRLLATAVALTLWLIGCKTTQSHNDPLPLTAATFFNKMDHQVGYTSDPQQLAQMFEVWQNKQRVLEKIMPLFDYTIKVQINGQTEVWKYTQAGYLMGKTDSKLYKISDPQVFNRNIKD